MVLQELLSREFLRVVEDAAIACARTMGQGDRKHSDARRRRGDAQGDGHAADARHGGDRRGRARRGADAVHRRARRHLAATTTPRSTSPSIRSRAPTCAPPARRTRSRCWRPSNKGGLLHAPDCYMEKIIVGPAAKGAVHLDATVKENLKAIATRARPRGQRPGGDRARSAAPREADRGHPQRRRAHPADHRRRPLRRHQRRRARAPTCTPSWASAARPRACSPPPRCAA